MPVWSHELPPEPKHYGFELRRTPPDRPLIAIVTAEDLSVCFTHFWGGRTVPCETPDCDACKALSPSRGHCYLSAIDAKTREHFLFECTTTAAGPFQVYRAAHGTLRGCLFQATRPKRRRNAKVEIQAKPCDLTKISLPKPPNVPQAMAVIWQLPGAAVQSDGALNSSPQFTMNRVTNDLQRRCPSDNDQPAPASSGNGRSH